jgi:cell division protein FtsB
MVGAIAVVVGVVSLFSVRGIKILELSHQLQSSLLARDEALIERDALEGQLALKDDLATIEDVARAELGWILPGEVRVVFVDPSATNSSEGD